MCTWKITTGSGFSLETEFYSYSFCGTTPMGCDFCGYVKIWDGRRPDLRLIGTYCTNQRKNPVRSTGKDMFVEFYGHRDMTTFEASITSRKGKFVRDARFRKCVVVTFSWSSRGSIKVENWFILNAFVISPPPPIQRLLTLRTPPPPETEQQAMACQLF